MSLGGLCGCHYNLVDVEIWGLFSALLPVWLQPGEVNGFIDVKDRIDHYDHLV